MKMMADYLTQLRYAFFLFLFLLSIGGIAQKNSSQKSEKSTVEEHGLQLKKTMPLYVYVNKGCDTGILITEINDSLKKEGFTILDNATSRSLSSAYNKKLFSSTKPLPGQTQEEVLASMTEKSSAENIYQELQITNYSCLDTLYNYTIQIHIFPKPHTTDKSLNFTLPFSSPAAIKDVILSLISRE